MHLIKLKSLQRPNEKHGECKEEKLADFSCWMLQSESLSLLLCLHVAVISEPIMTLVCSSL